MTLDQRNPQGKDTKSPQATHQSLKFKLNRRITRADHQLLQLGPTVLEEKILVLFKRKYS